MGLKTDLILLMDSTKNMVKIAHLGDGPKLKEATRVCDVRYDRFILKYDINELHVQPMTDKEFAELKANIQETMNKLMDLQKQYLQETGRSYVINGPNKHKP